MGQWRHLSSRNNCVLGSAPTQSWKCTVQSEKVVNYRGTKQGCLMSKITTEKNLKGRGTPKKMIFSRDAVASKLQALGNTAAERRQTLTGIVLVNVVLGAACFLGTLFTSGVWGSGVGFQATSTAIAQSVLNYIIFQWLKQPDIQKLDVIGGAFLMLLLMLLQTTLTFGKLSSGLVVTEGSIPCFINGSGGDRAVSILSTILLFTNTALGGLAYVWKDDFLQSNSGHYSSLSTVQAERKPSESVIPNASATPQIKGAFMDEDVEGGL